MQYRVVDKETSNEVAKLAVCLTNEIVERTGIKHFDVDIPLAEKLCKEFMEQGKYAVVAAFDNDRIVGFGALCESHSLYAEGKFGIVQEFYVLPEFRSKSIGKELLANIIGYGKSKQWVNLNYVRRQYQSLIEPFHFMKKMALK